MVAIACLRTSFEERDIAAPFGEERLEGGVGAVRGARVTEVARRWWSRPQGVPLAGLRNRPDALAGSRARNLCAQTWDATRNAGVQIDPLRGLTTCRSSRAIGCDKYQAVAPARRVETPPTARKETLGRITLESDLFSPGYVTAEPGLWPVLDPTAMIVLVDYDNLARLHRQRGPRYAVDRMLNVLGSRRVSGSARAFFRLYGGWLDGTNLSRNAQGLVPQLRRDFPRAIPVTDGHGTHTLSVHVELAFALLCDPRNQLTHTYRRRSAPPRLRCVTSPFPECRDTVNCPIGPLDAFLGSGVCPRHDCLVEPPNILERAEQKLVDSMILIDLVHLSSKSSDTVVVASADDDLWPGLRFVLLSGLDVIHLRPQRKASDPNRYRTVTIGKYSHVRL